LTFIRIRKKRGGTGISRRTSKKKGDTPAGSRLGEEGKGKGEFADLFSETRRRRKECSPVRRRRHASLQADVRESRGKGKGEPCLGNEGKKKEEREFIRLDHRKGETPLALGRREGKKKGGDKILWKKESYHLILLGRVPPMSGGRKERGVEPLYSGRKKKEWKKIN